MGASLKVAFGGARWWGSVGGWLLAPLVALWAAKRSGRPWTCGGVVDVWGGVWVWVSGVEAILGRLDAKEWHRGERFGAGRWFRKWGSVGAVGIPWSHPCRPKPRD